MAERIRVGVLGLGQLTCEVHLPNLASLPDVSVTALADPSPEARARAAAQRADARLFNSAEELLASGLVDAILIATPTGEHARHGRLAIKARTPFYLEKPLASELADAQDLCEAASASNVTAMIGFSYRFHPRVALLRESLQDVERVESRFTIAPRELPVWKRARSTGGGVLLDLGSHHFDLLPLLMRSAVEAVKARIWSERSEQDCAEVELQFENGAQAFCTFSFCRDESDVITFSRSGSRTTHDRYAPLTYPMRPLSGFVSYLAERRRSPWKEVSFRRSLAAWLDSIRCGQCPPIPLRDGLESLRIVDAAERSAAGNGARVRVVEAFRHSVDS
jgi:predicted dehydrogenase